MRPYIVTPVAAIPSSVLTTMAWPEMLVPIPGTISLVPSIIRIAIVPDSLKGVPVKHVGYVAVVNT
jgi:hypothetical protein